MKVYWVRNRSGWEESRHYNTEKHARRYYNQLAVRNRSVELLRSPEFEWEVIEDTEEDDKQGKTNGG
jgi:hypothetical protein